jgi:polar amino acid transport system substrate-binding protein
MRQSSRVWRPFDLDGGLHVAIIRRTGEAMKPTFRPGSTETARAGRADGLRSRLASLALIGAASLALCACQYPRDPEGTLDSVRGGTMAVGVVVDPPWAEFEGGEAVGVEPSLIRAFADQLDADVEWVPGSESELVAAMSGYQLDVIIGGLDRSSPWAKEVALTRPYLDTNVEIGGPPGYDPPEDLGGEEIWVEANSEAAALLKQEEEDAIPIFFSDLDEIDGPALLDSYEIDAIGYEHSSYILRDHEHAMAVPQGENAFLIELEHFLLDRGDEAEALLAREAGREARSS